jgi:starch phosphorylase
VRRVYYLSAEFLLGRALLNNLISLGIYDRCRRVLEELDLDITEILEEEPDAGLGNGGLGRLAACFQDSMATLGYPAIGYGIRYRFGIFEQVLRHGYQVEKPDNWLKSGSPWEIARPERSVVVPFYGRTESFVDRHGRWRVAWVDTENVVGVPFDRPVAGYGTDTVNTLRLWQATAGEEFDFQLFNEGDYERAVEKKNQSEVISKALYPNDKTVLGKELRLKQQFFFVRCALVDIIRRHLRIHDSLDDLAEKAAVQLNDTHPAIAVSELMRILVDQYRYEWEPAWATTKAVFSYTNHTVLSEALEKWSVDLLGRLLPRHLQIIYEINRRFLRQVRIRWPNDLGRVARMSLIEEHPAKKVRMANLAIVGSHAVNGVAALHTEILKRKVFRDFHELDRSLISSKTNGITPRRWLLQCNPELASMATELVGEGWERDLDRLTDLSSHASSRQVRDRIGEIKKKNKKRLSDYLSDRLDMRVDPGTLYDMQIKRLHEYKRQLLNVLGIIARYVRAKDDPSSLRVPRTYMFGAKAAPGYHMAKLIIKLINSVAEMIDEDRTVSGLAVRFVPNYGVTLAERMIPACEVSEQISVAGMEASGTGNMKLALNGALTVGTLDGANVEIRDAVGPESFFLFGMTADEVEATWREGYSPRFYYQRDPLLKEVIDLISSGYFCTERPDLFRPIVDHLLNDDAYRIMADFRPYIDCQDRVDEAYLAPDDWNRMSLLNIANMGRFSSDRTIREYAEEIWKVDPVEVKVPPYVSTDITSGRWQTSGE